MSTPPNIAIANHPVSEILDTTERVEAPRLVYSVAAPRPVYADFHKKVPGEAPAPPPSGKPFQAQRRAGWGHRPASSADWTDYAKDPATAVTDPTGKLGGRIYPLQDFKNSDAQNNVKYVTELAYRRRKYMITLGQKLLRAETNEEFDTARIKAFYLAKYKQPYEKKELTPTQEGALKDRQEKISKDGKQFKQIGIPVFGRDKKESSKLAKLAFAKEWEEKSLIWVCVDEEKPTFYSHIGKKDHFHHTSFNAAGTVLGAGEWIVQNGKLLKISANSGHYQPTLDYLYHCVLLLAEACNQDTTVLVWEPASDQWIDVPHLDFKQYRHEFTAHPRSISRGSEEKQEPLKSAYGAPPS